MIGRNKILVLLIFTALLFGCSSTKKALVIQDETPVREGDEIEQQDNRNEFQYLFVEGLKQKMLGNPQEAVKMFSGCLEIDPNSAAAMFELANIHASNNDFTSAMLLLEKAMSINPDNKWYKLMLARIYQQTKKFSEAVSIYNGLINQEPDNLDYLYMKALLLSGAGRVDEAIDAYRKIEEKVGLNEQISVSLQQLLVDAGRIKEAYAEIQKLIDSAPGEPQYYGLMADLYLSQGDKKNALRYYEKILELDPDNGFVHFSLANFYEESGDLDKSFEHTKKGFKSFEIDFDTKLQLYLMLSSNMNSPGLSNIQLSELIDILLLTHPDEPRVNVINAEFLIRENRLEEARKQLKNALEKGNTDYLIWERILIISNDLQDWSALYDDSNEALYLFPNQPQVYFLNGVACLQLEKFEETLDICEEGLNYVIDNPSLRGQFLLLQGEANHKLGDTEVAFSLFDKAIELDPDNHIALNNYAYYLSLIGSNLDKAERMSGKVIELYPNNATYLDTHAWVLFKKKNYQLAKFYMESAIKNGGEDNPVLLEHYGDILIMLNKKSEAKEYWLKAKEKGSDSTLLDRKISDLKYYENQDQ